VQEYEFLVEIVLKERMGDCDDLNGLGAAAYLPQQASRRLP